MFDDLAFIDAGTGGRAGALKLYALSACEHCRDGMKLLESRGFGYKYIYVDQLAPAERIRIKKDISQRFQRNLLFPLLELPGEEFLFGYDEAIWRHRLALLETPAGGGE